MSDISNEQINIARSLINLQTKLDNRIKSSIREDFLLRFMNDEQTEDTLEHLKESLKYIIDEDFRLIKFLKVKQN